ncbi:uncharacterized protein Z520_03422 [Fonsecaea multimorphosa CBS 102226]|uniref:FAS1 domain-containing protein n=1 Tax=Fonsecaea multimorphosa CBS 102226 TaxID=1442371 RepID=A0A0D2IUM7_9EURO|nr:uncharacterized protein Z520_03422 [Fonsecaea multimorphosa CBS 102226]KIY00757.1 hypothetical protein Z520_03422 [Fonsecaea multimorphosa CBS 102226]OAL27855.1 hypothetical protein AYO22_03200 [Fonsecaea multimorphosa]
MLQKLLPAVVCICLGLVTAQDEGIIETLNGVAELSDLVTYLDRFPDLTVWLQGLSDITFLAPNNDAFAALADSSTIPSIPLDAADAEALMSYHVLNGTFYSFSSDEYSLVTTALLSSTYENVTGGQVLAAKGSPWSDAISFTSGNLQTSETEGSALDFTGGIIYIIDSFLTLPGSFKETVEAEDMLGGSAFAEAVVTTGGQQLTIDQLSDVTVFLPMNYSLQEIGSVIENMTWTELERLVSYHVVDQLLDINPDSPPSGKYATYEGSEVTIFSQNGFVFINNARIVGSADWLFSGGMIYTIYGVLNPDNTTVDPNINDAEIAFANASFTLDFTFPSPGSQTSPAGSSTGASSGGLSGGAKAGIGVAVAIAAAAILLAGAFFLLRRRRRSPAGLPKGFQYPIQYPVQYPLKDLEVSISHSELVAKAAAPARGPLKDLTPSVSVYSLPPRGSSG